MRDTSGNTPGTGTPVRQVLADSIRWQRKAHELTQKDIAALMVALGFDRWTSTTVAKVEANDRTLAADELLALALVLQCSLADLLLGADGVNFGRARLDPSTWPTGSPTPRRRSGSVMR